jgi:hypothetical protein
MKIENLKRAQDIIGFIKSHENIVSKTNDTGLLPSIWLGPVTTEIPANHGRFLKRVIRDHYQAKINKLYAELESL